MHAEFISAASGGSKHPHTRQSSLRDGMSSSIDPGNTTPGASMRTPNNGASARSAPGTPGGSGAAANKMPTTFEELNRVFQSRQSLSHRINSVISVLESNRDNLRGFFSACYQPLLWQIFNFDDSASGWLQSVSNGREGRTAEREASMLLDFLSPTGPLMKAVLAADADGLMQFAFPLERLPVRTQRRLQTDPASLNQRLPYRNSVQRDSHGRFHVHLGLYHYFLFWSAYYACTEARGSSSSYDRRGRSSRRGLTYGPSSGRQWMAGLLGPSQRIQPYRELLLSHLQYFLPRGGNLGRDGSWGGVDYHRAGSVSQGEMLVSIMIEFWLPGADEVGGGAIGYHPMGGLVSDGARSPYAMIDTRSRGGYTSSPYDSSGMQRQYSYNPPNEDLINAVVLLTTYLFADTPGGSSKKEQSLTPRTPATSHSRASPHQSSPLGNSAREIERAKEMLQKPLYKFLREALTQWPPESTANLSPLINLWVTYLTPWSLDFPTPFRRMRSNGSPTSTFTRGLEAVTAVATDMKSSSPKFVGDGSPLPASGSGRGGRRNGLQQSDKLHVLHNVPFYCELTRHFLELCCKRVPVDAEGTATALLAVIKTLASWPDVLEILDDVEKTYNKYAMVDPYAPRQTNVEPPPPTPYDAFLPLIKSQIMDWDPPEVPATSSMEPITSTPIGHHYAQQHHGVFGQAPPPPPQLMVPKLSMFSVDQEGQTQIILALLERLDRDMSVVGPSHPLRSKVPKLRKAAFSVFRLDRLGEEATRRASHGKRPNAPEGEKASSGGVNRPEIGWAGLEKSKASAKGLYQGDWLHRPISDMEFPPLARLLIALTAHLREVTGDKTINLRPLAEYGSMLALFLVSFFIWMFIG